MNMSNILKDVVYGDHKPNIKLLFESDASKEIRIVFKKDQVMKKHKTSFPITVEIFEGAIEFGVDGLVYSLKKGDICSLPSSIPHDLKANEDSIVRLSLSKKDDVLRVVGVADK